MTQYPAIAVGGPPHSGKSVLTYSITRALRDAQVQHFVVRACPDGEGDFSHEAPQELVKKLRTKGKFSSDYVEPVCAALRRRQLPLIVDVGGKPSKEQEAIFEQCTHAIIISSDPQAVAGWHRIAEQYQLTLIADLESSLGQDEAIFSDAPTLQGRICGLHRGERASGPLFEQLVQAISNLFMEISAKIRAEHISLAPSTSVDLERLGRTLKIENGNRWNPTDLPKVIDYLPGSVDLSIYGRGPNWLYATIAHHVIPAQLHQFDPILGWITPIQPTLSENAQSDEFHWEITEYRGYTKLKLSIVDDAYLDYSIVHTTELPLIDLNNGLIIEGELPMWLLTSLVRAYQQAPFMAIFQPQIKEGPVVVKSEQLDIPVGSILS